MGSSVTTEVVVPLTFCQVAVAGLVLLKVTRSVSSTAWYITLPVFQSTPMDGSPAFVAKPLGAEKFWYAGVCAVAEAVIRTTASKTELHREQRLMSMVSP